MLLSVVDKGCSGLSNTKQNGREGWKEERERQREMEDDREMEGGKKKKEGKRRGGREEGKKREKEEEREGGIEVERQGDNGEPGQKLMLSFQ